jgi:hypothetical protein
VTRAPSTEELMDIVGKRLSDVRDVLSRAGLPCDDVMDLHPSVERGLAYQAAPIGTGNALGVRWLFFFAEGHRCSFNSRGVLQMKAYQGWLPHDLAFGDDRANARQKLSKPKRKGDHDTSFVTRDRRVVGCFVDGRLSAIRYAMKNDSRRGVRVGAARG